MQRGTHGSFSASTAAISAEVAGKTFEYNGTGYVPTDRTGAPSNGVRFIIYAVNPVTMQPVTPLQEVGYVQLTDLSGTTTQAARVVVVSDNITYLDYTVRGVGHHYGRADHRGRLCDRRSDPRQYESAVYGKPDCRTESAVQHRRAQRDVSIDLTMTTTASTRRRPRSTLIWV